MVRGVLSEGRHADAARMIEPLLGPLSENGSVDPGQAMLHCLMARIALLGRGDHRRALELLQPFVRSEHRAALDPSLRGEVALWLGWASVWQDDALYDDARALNLLDAAEHDFRSELNPSGRCWALLGQAQAYFSIDEYRLMLQSLREAALLLEKMDDVSAEIWLYHLSAAGARFEGRYRAASKYLDELERHAEDAGDDFALGRAVAARAVVAYETGRKPSEVIDLARRAERVLRRTAAHPGYALLNAYHAHAGALIRLGHWSEVDRLIEEGLQAVGHLGTAPGCLNLHRVQLALLRRDLPAARVLLERITPRTHGHHRLLRSEAERVTAEYELRRGELGAARERADRALRHAREVGHAGSELAGLLQQARVAIASGDETAAREILRQAEAHADYFSLLPFAAERFFIHGLLADLRGRADEARAAFAQALSAYSLVGDVYASARTQLELARLTPPRMSGEARPLARAALDTFESLGAREDADRARRILSAETGTLDVHDASASSREADIGSVLARSALSVELVAESWLQAAEALAPDRWFVVYRFDGRDDWSLVHEHGQIPSDLAFPHPTVDRVCTDGVDWMRLRGLPAPAFFFGMQCGGEADPACAAVEKRLLPWIPVVGLALEHALLRAARLGDAAGDNPVPDFDLGGFIYTSPGMRRVAHQIQRVRLGRSPVLITGERGVGKGVVARAIHEASDRRDGPFVPFACTGVAADAIEAALFGTPSREGALRSTGQGTLYLDEIADLPPPLHPVLLRVLEEGFIETDAGGRLQLDVRVVASTSRDLKELVRKGRFLEDLYYRLNLVPIRVPPLRERREEIPLLVHHFLRDLTHGRPGSASVTSRAMDALIRYDWPGNVRQLRNEIERVLVFSAAEPVSTIDLEDLSESIRSASKERTVSMDADGSLERVALDGRGLDEILANAERSVIQQILARHDGQVSATADALGLSRQGLYKKMKRLGIDAASVSQR